MKVLVTGFDPFGGEMINPALEVVRSLPEKVDDIEVIKLEIPTVYRKSVQKIEEAIIKYNPDVILSIGQAGGRSSVTVERVAINVDDYGIKDNEGNQPVDKPIQDDGENAYFSKLPIKAIVKAIKESSIPANISDTAGTFVCNHVMYGVLYLIDKKYKDKKSGFIHIPYLPEQVASKGANIASMSKEDVKKAIIVAIKTIAQNENDINEIGGAIC